jgi:hypothetical protein
MKQKNKQQVKRKKSFLSLIVFLIALFLEIKGGKLYEVLNFNIDTLVDIQATVDPSTVYAQNTKLRIFGTIIT